MFARLKSGCASGGYKGAHLRAGTADKNIGELWQRESAGHALFLMPTKKQGAPSVREQIERKIKE